MITLRNQNKMNEYKVSLHNGEKEITAGGKYVIITSRISKESKIPRASENIESLIRADALRLRRSLRLAQWNHGIINLK